MKICVLMVGAIRPSANQIITNIENNIKYFGNNYSTHTFDFVVCTYKTEIHYDVLNYCNIHNIANYFINPIQNSDIPTELQLPPPNNNRYRMFYSMNYVLNKISTAYDCVIRLRIDTQVLSFELMKNIEPETYYTVLDTPKSCSDNIGYGTMEVMKNVWNMTNCNAVGKNNETAVFNSIMKNKYRIVQFKFVFVLYQNNSDMFDGIAQWSKCNRQWSYDGKTYIRGKVL